MEGQQQQPQQEAPAEQQQEQPQQEQPVSVLYRRCGVPAAPVGGRLGAGAGVARPCVTATR
jgi:hypothetical protein